MTLPPDNDVPGLPARRDPLDEAALTFAKTWPHWPELHDMLWYRGVNLGETDEYVIFADAMDALVARLKDPES